MDLRNTRTTILNQGDAAEKREEIRRYFHATYSLDEQLYETLASEKAFYLRPEPLRHPLIFYLGHTATFYINKLIVAKITNARINPRFESMFAIGVDEMSWDDLNAAHYDWPTLAEVMRGIEPRPELVVLATPAADGTSDVVVLNQGTDRGDATSFRLTWHGARLVGADTITGWSLERTGGTALIFRPPEGRGPISIFPGGSIRIGWLRFDKPVKVEALFP